METSLEAKTRSLAAQVLQAPRSGRRRLVALAGPPASGKSTLADHLAKALCEEGCQTHVVPMDGFHLDNTLLMQRGLVDRKGAPQTFDIHGLLALVARLHNEKEIVFPQFDRTRDIAIAGASAIDPSCDTVIVEGNYLLYDAPGWRDLSLHWDLSITLNVDTDTLRARLIERWVGQGLSTDEATARAEKNDLPNATLVARHKLKADFAA